MARVKTATRVIHNAGQHRVIGHSHSLKNRGPVPWESQIERDYFLLLEHDPRVVRYVPQPETIAITLDPRWVSYTPDVMVFYDDGTVCRVEVKSDDAMHNSELVARLEVIRAQYLLEGKDFRVVTASEIRVGKRIENLRALRYYARFPLDEAVVASAEMGLRPNPGITVGKAARQLAHNGVDQPLAVLYHLMFRQRIAFDLENKLINLRTRLYWRQL